MDRPLRQLTPLERNSSVRQNRLCRTCMHWQAPDTGGSIEPGWCHALPPAPRAQGDSVAAFPVTLPTMWCASWANAGEVLRGLENTEENEEARRRRLRDRIPPEKTVYLEGRVASATQTEAGFELLLEKDMDPYRPPVPDLRVLVGPTPVVRPAVVEPEKSGLTIRAQSGGWLVRDDGTAVLVGPPGIGQEIALAAAKKFLGITEPKEGEGRGRPIILEDA